MFFITYSTFSDVQSNVELDRQEEILQINTGNTRVIILRVLENRSLLRLLTILEVTYTLFQISKYQNTFQFLLNII